MREIARIVDQLDRAFEGDAWHGDPLMMLLEGVSADQAAQKPLRDAHSIWELTLHIAAWENVARRRLSGEMVPDPPPEENWEPVDDTTPTAWTAACARLRERHDALRGAVAGFADARLDNQVPAKNYSYYVLLHGVIQHTLYHAGQIALLKKG
jgi:uncharacterized damage-inducible protein DinB